MWGLWWKPIQHWAWFFLEELSQNHVKIVCTFVFINIYLLPLLLFFVSPLCHHPCCCFILIKNQKKEEEKITNHSTLSSSFFLSFLSFLLFHCKIDWENRIINDIGNDCLLSVDGTYFALAWGSNQQRLSCYKLKGKPGLQYKVAVCLRTSNIVWISGPHFPELYNDL